MGFERLWKETARGFVVLRTLQIWKHELGEFGEVGASISQTALSIYYAMAVP